MKPAGKIAPTVLVIFGGAGDLTWRKLIPSLFDLHRDGRLPEHFAIIAVDRVALRDHALRKRLLDGVGRFAREGKLTGPAWHQFARHITYQQGDFKDPATYLALRQHCAKLDRDWQANATRVFHMATPPAMPEQLSEIAIQFRGVPHQYFPREAARDWHPARLILSIQPEEAIVLEFQAKQPGPKMRLSPVAMHFNYRESFAVPSPDAYETLLWDVMNNDPSLFMRADQVEAAWQLLMPILNVWKNHPARGFPNYPAGTWGPKSALKSLQRTLTKT